MHDDTQDPATNPAATHTAAVPTGYERPQVADLGDVHTVTLGNAKDDTADMNTARYW